MTSRNDSQLRDIEDLIAKLNNVNRLLALPVRAMPMSWSVTAPESDSADLPTV